MQVKQETINPTTVKLSVIADEKELSDIKKSVVDRLGKNVKLPGFREGKAPSSVVEKQLDQPSLQAEFLNDAVNELYSEAAREKQIRAVKEPQVSINKFVPFTTLEFTAEIEAVGEIKLADYTKVKVTPKKASVTAEEINGVIENLRDRAAEKQDVKRAVKDGDEVTIDFKGTDAKTKESIEGADGTAYPLVIGSKSFIPGFEEELIGLKLDGKKTFNITFPKDYGAKELQNRLVSFEVDVKAIKELVKPKLDDKFVASVGPFKTVAELKADVKIQLQKEKQSEEDQKLNNEILQQIADKTDVALPETLIEEEIDRLEDEEKRSIAYRGQTWQEHLDLEKVTADEHRTRQRGLAETRIKTGLILGEISEKEGIAVTADELETRLNLLKSQYQDPNMQAELDKPENQRDLYSRLLIEKTIERLREIALKPAKTPTTPKKK
jgi:trigger factor